MAHRIEASILIPHGVVFIYDPTMIIDVPRDTAAAAVLSTTRLRVALDGPGRRWANYPCSY